MKLFTGLVAGLAGWAAHAQQLPADQLQHAPGASSADWVRALPQVPAYVQGPVLPRTVATGPEAPVAFPRVEPFQGEVQQPSKLAREARPEPGERPSRRVLLRLPEGERQRLHPQVERLLNARGTRELFHGWYFFELPEELPPGQVRRLLQGLPQDVVYVPDSPMEAHVTWNDPLLSTGAWWPQNQWYLYNVGQRTGITGSPYDYDIDADEAWDVTLAAHGRGQFYYSTVAVVDSQIDLSHADGPEFVGACTFTDSWQDSRCLPPETARTHGTAVAGLIAGRAGNGYGMSGVNWGSRILALNVSHPSNPERSFGYYQVINAIDYATRNGAHVINYSGGSRYAFQNNDNDPLYAAIRRAGERDILFVTSAGNDNLNLDCGNSTCQVAPAGMDLYNVWTVAAVDDRFDRSYFYTAADGTVYASNYGATSVDSAAFGSDAYGGGDTDLVSLYPGNQFAPFRGTSAAAPLVSGVAGLIKSLRPQATPYVYMSCFGYTIAPQLNGLVRYPGVINAKSAADCALSFGEQVPPPVFNVTSPAHYARLGGRSASLSWQAAPDFYVNYDVFLDGQFVGRTSGTSYYLPNVSDGTHQWSVRAVDAYGNWRNSTHVYYFVMDGVYPTAAVLTSPSSYQYVRTVRPALRWMHASDANGISGYQIIMDGRNIGNVGTVGGYDWPTDLTQGSHYWRVMACDTHQNCTTSPITRFTVDTVAPTQPTPVSPAHGAVVGSRRPLLEWSASGDLYGVSYRVSIDSGAYTFTTSSTQHTPAVDLADGPHTWSISACDPAGNCASSSMPTFTVSPSL
ncbi:S8 family serine peptidase [Archangium sp. Cb G35]|uniref:S8 family serine peptidase n=1 Tax=Archangium sp. Cb G35 TaxID=1920190 RepID=UPI001300FAB6|nr:S8 family serine peptidase [Archangium sp. Cb G35]